MELKILEHEAGEAAVESDEGLVVGLEAVAGNRLERLGSGHEDLAAQLGLFGLLGADVVGDGGDAETLGHALDLLGDSVVGQLEEVDQGAEVDAVETTTGEANLVVHLLELLAVAVDDAIVDADAVAEDVAITDDPELGAGLVDLLDGLDEAVEMVQGESLAAVGRGTGDLVGVGGLAGEGGKAELDLGSLGGEVADTLLKDTTAACLPLVLVALVSQI